MNHLQKELEIRDALIRELVAVYDDIEGVYEEDNEFSRKEAAGWLRRFVDIAAKAKMLRIEPGAGK